jgi:ATP-dependent DNA ligase
LDGELVVLDEDGRSNFAKLAHGRIGTHYYGFDLLVLGDADLRARSLEARKAMLTNLLHGCSDAVSRTRERWRDKRRDRLVGREAPEHHELIWAESLLEEALSSTTPKGSFADYPE